MSDIIEQLGMILSNHPLAFKFAILIGIILIIISAAPSLGSILKISALTLTRNQSIMLSLIGVALIISGIVGLSQIENEPPIVYSVVIDPMPALIREDNLPINVTINASDPDSNFIQKFIHNRTLRYYVRLTNYTDSSDIHHDIGPKIEKNFTIYASKTDVGKNKFAIYVIDRPIEVLDFNKTPYTQDYMIMLADQRPTIESVEPKNGSIEPINKEITIRVKAQDPENQELYYKFYKKPYGQDVAKEMPPMIDASHFAKGWTDDGDRSWTPKKGEEGDNLIIVDVIDGDSYGPYVDKRPVRHKWIINISGKT